MKNHFQRIFVETAIVTAAVLFAAGISFSQSVAPAPTPNVDAEVRERMNRINTTNRRFEALNKSGRFGSGKRADSGNLQTIVNFYRKPTSEELAILLPDEEDQTKYAGFLNKSNTGLTRLFRERGCADSSIVVVATEECLRFSMPGGGASYSFRTENHRIWRLADLTYTGKQFQSLGVLSQGIIVNIGDISIEEVSLKTIGLKFLTSFKPVEEFEEAKKIDIEFMNGVDAEGFKYARSQLAEENATYALRSIAYRGSVYKSFLGITYDELDFDKRKDVLIVFRVVRRDDESVTILWKELQKKDAPKIKVSRKSDKS